MKCACGCGRELEQQGRGRERRYATPSCRSAAAKDREHREAAIAAARVLANLDEDRLVRRLAVLPPAALRLLAENQESALQPACRTR